jgi:hypothetical protein
VLFYLIAHDVLDLFIVCFVLSVDGNNLNLLDVDMASKFINVVDQDYSAIMIAISDKRISYTEVRARGRAWYRKASRRKDAINVKSYSNRIKRDYISLLFWAALFFEVPSDLEESFAQLSRLRLTQTNRVSKMWWLFSARKDRGDLEAAAVMLDEIERRIRVSRPRVKWPTKKILAEARAGMRLASMNQKSAGLKASRAPADTKACTYSGHR